jgi:hypothetical protein
MSEHLSYALLAITLLSSLVSLRIKKAPMKLEKLK